MGYEICYMYHERLPDGKYNVEEKKELKKKVGSALEEVPLEQLAAVVMSQLARRDIWVVDVELFEIAKKKISFKESTDGSGVIIKNKKFGLDRTGSNLITTDVEDISSNGLQPHELVNKPRPQIMVAKNNELAPHNNNLNRIITWMAFDPGPRLAETAKMKFTIGKRYPIYQMDPHPKLLAQQLYTTVDDTGAKKTIDDDFFVPVIKLVGDGEIEGGTWDTKPTSVPDARLSAYAEVTDAPMPKLR